MIDTHGLLFCLRDDTQDESMRYGTLVSYGNPSFLHKISPAVLVIGAFDGLHLGHRMLVQKAASDAASRGVPCVAVTFDPDPSELLSFAPKGERLLSPRDRAQGLLDLGARHVAILSFTQQLRDLSARQFVGDVLQDFIRPVSVHVGSDFRFGRNGTGDVKFLHAEGTRCGFDTHVHGLLTQGGQPISATRIRSLLGLGMVEEANKLLGRYHFVRGRVQHGRGEATGFGFPTANVSCDHRDCLPKEGVYACYVMHDGFAWPAAANVGAPPTFANPRAGFLEANLLGFSGDLYGKEVRVAFVSRLRDAKKFETLEDLTNAVRGNIEWVSNHLGDRGIEVGK